jgi:signal transduction histidine kinase/DNA-binding response OmpR family regulator/ligand-binding sensor domain-containing protein
VAATDFKYELSWFFKTIILTLMLLMNFSLVFAAPLKKFHQISREDGLVSDSVYTTVVDQNNFVWFGTDHGLQRFDGNDFKTFSTSTSDTGGKGYLSHLTVRVILVDKNNNLWIGTEKGLDFYDSTLEQLHNIELPTLTKKDSPVSSNFLRIRTLFIEDDLYLWIGGYHGLTRYDIQTGNIKHFDLPTIRSISPIVKNKMLLGTLHKGLLLLDTITGKSEQLPKSNNIISIKRSNNSQDSQDIYHNDLSVIGITPLNAELFLISTWGNGLLVYSNKKNTLSKIALPDNEKFVRNTVLVGNSIWISSQSSIYVADKQLKKITDVTLNNEEILSVANRFTDIQINKNNQVLVSSFGHGVFIHEIKNSQFEFYKFPSTNKNNQDVNDIAAIKIVDQQHLAFFNASNLVFIWNTEKQEVSKVVRLPNDYLTYTSVHLALNGDYVSTDRLSGKPVRFSQTRPEKDSLKLADKKLSESFLIHGYHGIPFLIGIEKKTKLLHLFDLDENGYITHLASSKILIESGNLISGGLFYDENKIVLAIRDKYLLKMTIEGSKLTVTEKANYLVTDRNLEFNIDSSGLLWFINFSGEIYSFESVNIDSAKPKMFAQVPRNMISRIDRDSDILWIATTEGIKKVALNSQDIFSFDEFDGLQSHEFNHKASVVHNGYFYFGGIGGFNRFKTSMVTPDLDPIAVNLTNFAINGESATSAKSKLLDSSIVLTKSISPKYSQNNLTFQFSSPTLPGEQKKLTYAYILDGFEDNWHYVDYKKRLANYTNIPHGDYTFRVKVKNKNGIWSEQDRTLAISISPPWWLTTWAYLAYILTVIIIFYALIQYRTKALTRRSKFLEKEVTARTKEVEQLLEKQNQEFANISHEFRTPLTLILGPISNVLKKLNPKTQSSEIKQLETTQRNSYRLLRMVDQLLNIESFQVKSIVQKQPIAFGETTRLIADGFKELAKEKNCEFIVEDIVQINFEFTPDAYEKILLNLLSNAFKYTPTNGKISLKTSVHGSEFILTVSDTGIGIPAEEQANIFERFNRSTNVNQENAPGAGIGLSLVKNLVELHQGKIHLESQPQIGTTFTITLPIVNPTNSAEFIYGIDESLIDVELMTLAAQSPVTHQAVSAAGDENTNRETILIIEDNDDMRHYIQESVSATYKVLTASDGEQGVSIAVQEIPDLIISDIMMPKLDGYQVTSQLRQHTATSHIPIILLTAKDDKVSRMKGWHERADEYLTKPFDVNELNIRIKSLLEIRDLLKQRFADSIFKADAPSNSTDELENQEQIFIRNLNKVMEEFYTDHQIKISEISSKVAMSDRQLSRKLKSTVDMTPTEYLRKYRLERAKDLLSKGETVTNTAFQVGFTSSSYFTSCFKAHVGVKPSEFTSLKKA